VRKIQGTIRVLQDFLALTDDYPNGHMERTAQRALEQGAWRLRELEVLLE
jgi:hypothetical protein